MIEYLIYVLLLIIFSWLGMENGASSPISAKWQKTSFLRALPEIVNSLLIGVIAGYGYYILGLTVSWWTLTLAVVISSCIAYAGIQTATWAMLQWEKHVPRNPDRQSTIRPIVDYLAGKLGYALGDEGYSWIWAAVKGFITTLPIFGLGAVFFTLGNELGSHAKGRLPGDPNMWKEFCGGLGLGIACTVYLIIIESVK